VDDAPAPRLVDAQLHLARLGPDELPGDLLRRDAGVVGCGRDGVLLGIDQSHGGSLARIIHEAFVKNPGLPDEQPFPPTAGGYLVVGGPGTHPPGWVPVWSGVGVTGFFLGSINRMETPRRLLKKAHLSGNRLLDGCPTFGRVAPCSGTRCGVPSERLDPLAVGPPLRH